MKQSVLSKFNLSSLKLGPVGTCLTIFGSLALVLLTVSILTACNSGSTTNIHGADKAGMSGGGATKDPGDGTGGSTGDGGGGQGIQCGDSSNLKIKNRLFVRDIYEAINDQKLQMRVIPNDSIGSDVVSAEAIKVLVNAIRPYFGPASPNLEFATEDFWKNFSNKISFVGEDRQLHASQDANSPIALPNECRVVQIAYWSDSSGESDGGTLYVSEKYWRQLDQLNKIALMAHEFFFKQARKAHYRNSDTVRFGIGQMLSTNAVSPLFKDWSPSTEERAKEFLPATINGFKVCKGSSSEEPAANIQFYQYEGKSARQHFTIPLLTSNSINLSYLNATQFSFDPKENFNLAAATDLLFIPPMWYPLYFDGNNVYPGGAFADWFARWYSNIGIISNGNLDSNILSFAFRIDMAIKESETFFRGNAGPIDNPVKIELLNHTHALKNVGYKAPKSRDELISEIHRQMKSDIQLCYFLREESLDRAILIIDKEVRDFISVGDFPTSYPRWESLLESLKPRPWDPRGGPDRCQNKRRILHDLPNALLNVSANNHNDQYLIHLLGKQFFLGEGLREAVPGIMRVSQNNRTLDFQLTCEDYRDVYFKNFGNKNALTPDLATQNKVVVMATKSQQKIDVAAEEKAIQVELYFKKFISFLSFTQNGQQNFQHLISSYQQACSKVTSASELQWNSCRHHQSFLSDLSSEKNIQIKFCSEFKGFEQKDKAATCVIAEMKTTQNSYLIYFSMAEGTASEIQDMPTLELVRLIPSKLQ